jgi:ubiquinone/menaquinone biosynthesis C-methylase UbiE
MTQKSENVYKFYNKIGWKTKYNNTKDASLFEDLRNFSKDYVSKCRNRVKKFIPQNGDHILDFASGPIQYKEYINYSKGFKIRHCVDFSKEAIAQAKKKIGNKGKYYCKDFFKIKFKKNYFDCIISMHTIYHIEKNKQKKTIKKLIEISKPNSPIIIVYSNPKTLISFFTKAINKFFYIKKKKYLYFFAYPNTWWKQFEKLATVKILPWRSFSSQHQKILFPDNVIGELMLKLLFLLEERFEKFFSKYFQYTLIILKKRI